MSNETTTAVAVKETPIDNGKPALYNPAAFAQIWRAAQMFSSSDLVPTAYKGKPENCFIAIEMADRMGISPFAMLQSLVIIQGKPSMEAKLIIALVNDSGIFEDPLEYEIVGDDPYPSDEKKPELCGYKVRAFAKMRKTGKLCLGPWITYPMVVGEGWLSKGGSKWKTMPSIMFMYRAASFFAKVYCPNITMGMQTREEMEDVAPINITPERKEAPALVAPSDDNVQKVIEEKKDEAPPLAKVEEEQPKRERGKASPGKKRRTDAEMEEDRLADEAEILAQQQEMPATMVTETVDEETGELPLTEDETQEAVFEDDDDSFPDPPGSHQGATNTCPDLF